MKTSAPTDTALRRSLGSGGIALLAINGVIGAGIFALPGSVAAAAGNLSPWLFLLVGALFLTIVLSFAELSAYFRSSGGPARYAHAAFGPVAGFSAGWLFYVGRLTAFAANVVVMATYAGVFWPQLTHGIGRDLFIIAFCGLLTLANYLGIRGGIRTVALFTVLKLAPLGLLVLLGLGHVSVDTLIPSDLPMTNGVGELALLLIFAYIGFESATVVAGETKNPRRTLPAAIAWTVVGVAVMYFFVMLVFVAVIPEQARDGALLSDVGQRLAGDPGRLMIAVAAVFSIGGNLAATMVSAPRLTHAMAEQALLPPWFARIHPRYNTPGNAIVVHGVLSALLALSGTFVLLAIATSLSRLVTFVLSIAALPLLRRRRHSERSTEHFRLPGGMFIPGIALLTCTWMAVGAPASAWLMTAALLLVGLALYAMESARRR